MYAPGDVVLEGLEKEAREAKKGLWVDPQPVLPWEYESTDRKPDLHKLYRAPCADPLTPALRLFAGGEFARRVPDIGVKYERRVREAGQSLQASTLRVAGWPFCVSPHLDRSPSKHPTGTLAPQCASLALVLVVGETARHLSRQQPDRFSCPLRWLEAFRTRSGRSPTAEHLLS